MSTETVTDLAALVGEMEAPPCDSNSHARGHADRPASTYVRVRCACGSNAVRAYCDDMVAWILGDQPVRCRACRSINFGASCATILGPVGK